ncbi:unnamed protein product, partial [Phaeothamnion confervicola]
VALHGGLHTFVSGGNDRTLRVWDKRVQGSVGVLRGHRGPVTCADVALSDRNLLLSGSADRTVLVWDTRSTARGPVRCLHGHRDRVTCLLRSGAAVFAGGEDGALVEWDWATGDRRDRYEGHAAGVSSVA